MNGSVQSVSRIYLVYLIPCLQWRRRTTSSLIHSNEICYLSQLHRFSTRLHPFYYLQLISAKNSAQKRICKYMKK